MRIKRLSWSNYRRLPNGELSARNHVVLIGPNDTGKSSILRALSMCLGMPHAQLAAAITSRDFTDPAQKLVIKVVLDDINDDDRAAFPDEITIGPPDVLDVQLEASHDSADLDQKTIRRFFPDAGHERAPTREQLKAIGFEFVPAARSLYRELGGGEGTVRSLLSSLDLGQDAESLRTAIAGYRDVLEQSEALGSFREGLATALTEALPMPVPRDRVKVTSEADVLGDPLSGVVITVRDGEYDVPLAEQSDGIRAMSLLTLLGMSHKTAKIVALDEPETHLHPVAQRAVAQSLQRSSSQKVLVTHSPSIVSRMDPLDIITVGADRCVHQIPLAADIAALEATIRHWSYRLIEPLTARRVVTVEGPADRILFERVAELLRADLDRRGIAVFELDGKDRFPLAHRLFGPAGFGLALAGLLDQDAQAAWASEIGCPPADLSGHGYFVCDPDLEAAYVAALGTTRVVDALCAARTIGQNTLLQGCRVASLADVDEPRLIAFCRRHKADAAIAVSVTLTNGDAHSIAPLASLVAYVVANA